MKLAYLTIDDSPSSNTDKLTDFLVERGVPAVLFCVGERLEKNFAPVVRAIERGLIVGNHSYAHRRASRISVDELMEEIRRTEALIDRAYKEAGVTRKAKYFRFPHMDRGTAGWVVDYDRVDPAYRDDVIHVFASGLNITLDPPTAEMIDKKHSLQARLKAEGFSPLPSSGVTHPWFTSSEMAEAVDAMYTFSTSDWMVSARHLGKWPYKSLDDLKNKINTDKWLQESNSHHIILAHDQEEIDFVCRDLIDHCLDKGFEFLPFE